MPDVHFIGELSCATGMSVGCVSVTWALVPGNSVWSHAGGSTHGETQMCYTTAQGRVVLNHPLDVHYSTTALEGWPVIVLEFWDRSLEGLRGFLGCCCVHMPQAPGHHTVDAVVWRPLLNTDSGNMLDRAFLPTIPDLTELREHLLKPNMRVNLKSETVGSVSIDLTTIVSGFDVHGVSFGPSSG